MTPGLKLNAQGGVETSSPFLLFGRNPAQSASRLFASALAMAGSVNVISHRKPVRIFYQDGKKIVIDPNKKDGGPGAAGAADGIGADVSAWVYEGQSAEEYSGPRYHLGLPLRTQYKGDARFDLAIHRIPHYWPTIPAGFHTLTMAGTEEFSEASHVFPADPRLVAVNASGDPRMGTVVVDLKGGEPDSNAPNKDPGMDGRTARMQSMCRVIRLPEKMDNLGIGPGNGLAWQCALSGQDGLAGFGLSYGSVVDKTEAVITEPDIGSSTSAIGPPTTPSEGPYSWKPSDTGEYLKNVVASMRADMASGTGSTTFVAPSSDGVPAAGASSFAGGRSVGSPAVGLAAEQAGGPFCFGSGDEDKHKIDSTKDGEPIVPVHLPTTVLFHAGKTKDAPADFCPLEYRKGKVFDEVAQVFLSYDTGSEHTLPDGRTFPGLWRWWTTVPCSDDGPGPVPIRPRDPTGGPSPGTPGDPDPPPPEPPGLGGGPTITPRGRNPVIGGVRGPGAAQLLGQLGLLSMGHPDPARPFDTAVSAKRATAFSETHGRPQMYHAGCLDFRNSHHVHPDTLERESQTRPSSYREAAFGHQGGGEWIYSTKPSQGRVPWGTCGGGKVFMAPQYDPLDSADDFVRPGVTASTTYIAIAPSVYYAAGSPDLATGAMRAGAWRWTKDSGDDLTFAHFDGTTWTTQLTLTAAGLVDSRLGLTVAGTQVVGTQAAAINDPIGGGTVDVECREAVSDLLAKLRTHGLINT